MDLTFLKELFSSPLEIGSLIAVIAFVIGSKAKDIIMYFKIRGNLERSLEYRNLVLKKYFIRVRSLEERDKAVRVIRLDDKDFKNVAIIKKAYSNLIEFEAIDDSQTPINKGSVREQGNTYYLVAKYLLSMGIKNERSFLFSLNAGLIKSLIQLAATSTSKAAVDTSSIVGVMVGQKIKTYTRSYALLFVALAAYLTSGWLGLSDLSPFAIALLAAVLACLSLNQKLLEYRIKKGFYGTGAYEVREILRFIIEHTDKSDFSDSDKMKRLMPELQADQTRQEVVYGGAYQ